MNQKENQGLDRGVYEDTVVYVVVVERKGSLGGSVCLKWWFFVVVSLPQRATRMILPLP